MAPPFAALIAALYSLYLLFVGLPKLMQPAADKAMLYALSVIGCMIVVGIVGGAIVRAVVRFGSSTFECQPMSSQRVAIP